MQPPRLAEVERAKRFGRGTGLMWVNAVRAV